MRFEDKSDSSVGVCAVVYHPDAYVMLQAGSALRSLPINVDRNAGFSTALLARAILDAPPGFSTALSFAVTCENHVTLVSK